MNLGWNAPLAKAGVVEQSALRADAGALTKGKFKGITIGALGDKVFQDYVTGPRVSGFVERATERYGVPVAVLQRWTVEGEWRYAREVFLAQRELDRDAGKAASGLKVEQWQIRGMVERLIKYAGEKLENEIAEERITTQRLGDYASALMKLSKVIDSVDASLERGGYRARSLTMHSIVRQQEERGLSCEQGE